MIKLSGKVFGYETAYDLKRYARMLSKISEKVQPVVVAGGGKVARHYISTARSFGSDEASLDILGIEVSRLNARLMILALGDQAYPGVPKDLEQVSKAVTAGRIVVTGGLHPGQSTNATAHLLLKRSKRPSSSTQQMSVAFMIPIPTRTRAPSCSTKSPSKSA